MGNEINSGGAKHWVCIMTREATRVKNRTAIAIDAVRACIEMNKVQREYLDDFVNDAAHLAYNRPGYEGHIIRAKMKDDIWRSIQDII
jgi:hypothetical protein